jgi:predicted nucleotidyltransferase
MKNRRGKGTSPCLDDIIRSKQGNRMHLKVPKKKIAALCIKHRIILMILHGSQASGRANRQSDVDIGILTTKKIDSEQHLKILHDFSEIFGDQFDPVILNGAEPLITYQVAIHGKPLFEQRKGAFAAFQVQAISRYLDSKKFRELEKIYIKRAIAGV